MKGEKFKLRKQILKLRNGQSEGEIAKKSLRIQERLFNFPLFKESKTIMFYVSKGSEVKTEVMIKESLFSFKKKVVVPVTQLKEKKLLLSELRDYDRELVSGTFNILEPKKEFFQPVDFKKIDLVIVPGIVFDETGNRIGYGGGFYDNFLKVLKNNVSSLGLTFELQILKRIPVEEKDMKVNCLLTEDRLIFCEG